MKTITCRPPALVAAGVMLVCMTVNTGSGVAVSTSASEEISYEDFMRLGHEARQTTFSQLSAETKSALKREHAKRWLARNERQLTGRQQALLREAIEFLSPELYRSPLSAAQRRQEEDLKHRLECSLPRARLVEALTFLGPQPPPTSPTFHDRVIDWLAWFSDCVVR